MNIPTGRRMAPARRMPRIIAAMAVVGAVSLGGCQMSPGAQDSLEGAGAGAAAGAALGAIGGAIVGDPGAGAAIGAMAGGALGTGGGFLYSKYSQQQGEQQTAHAQQQAQMAQQRAQMAQQQAEIERLQQKLKQQGQ